MDCGHPIESKANHPLHCKFSHGRQPRHKSINNILLAALKKVNIPSILEPVGLSKENAIRPDGISLIPWTNSLPLAWDYTYVDFAAESNLSSSAIEKAEILKKTNMLASPIPCLSQSLPTLGMFGSDALNFIKTIGKKMRQISGDP
ncbi:unnamed protein product, partial [Gordionus sp. m RMFG-2023]